MELAAHWHRCQDLPKKRVNTLLLYRERDDPVKERLANWRTRSGTPGSVEERYTGTLHGRTSKILATWQIDSYPAGCSNIPPSMWSAAMVPPNMRQLFKKELLKLDR